MAILRRNVSEKLAFELITQGFEFSALEAKSYGLINRIFPEAAFDDQVKDYLSAYENVSRSAVVLSKKLLYQMDGLAFDDALKIGAEVNAEARMTDDCKEGIARFLEKK
jgi:methylglutaconyl-CoA hydratase